MGDQIEYFRAARDHYRSEHANNKAINLALIQQSGLKFRVTNNGECLVFREHGKPKVDFYPSSGRWRDVGTSKRNYRGGAGAFLTWYANQKGSV